MNRTTALVVYLLAGTVLPELWSTTPAKEPNPPAGFRAIFNGKDKKCYVQQGQMLVGGRCGAIRRGTSFSQEGRSHDYPEQFAAGLAPHAVQEKYYYARRPEVNRVVDVSGVLEQLIDCQPRQPGQGAGRKSRLAATGRPGQARPKTPAPGRRRRHRRPQLHQGVHPGPPARPGPEAWRPVRRGISPHRRRRARSAIEDYVKKNAVPIK